MQLNDPIDDKRLEAARAAVDRRNRRQRRKVRRARRARHRIGWTLVWLLAVNAVAFIGLGTPTDPLQISTYLGLDKIEHAIAFVVVTAIAIPAAGRWISPAISLILALMLGLMIEILQAYTPNRTADFGDFVADELGILLGWGIGVLILRWLRGRFGAPE